MVRLLDPLPPVLQIAQGEPGPRLPYSLTGSEAVLEIPRGGHVRLVRETRTATFHASEPLTPEELVHPGLGAAASVFSHWDGRAGFHAGAFLAHDRAWVVLGGNEAGKSTTLAALAAAGVPIVADDFVAVLEGRVLAGPRSIDLRQSTVEALSLEGGATAARGGSRWRLPLDDVPAEVPLGGWLFLEWGDRITIEKIRAGERLGRLSPYRPVQATPSNPTMLLDLATLPAWQFLRPRRWDLIDSVIDSVLTTVELGS